jgi:diadenosine tetraphosphate (Ap4A) HIT family hydrolase
MPDSIFIKMLKGEIPREIIYQDDVCFVIPTIAPHNPGHCLVITNQQVENWEDLDKETYLHTMNVAQEIGKVLKQVYSCPKVGIATVGFEVPHVHIHLIPLFKLSDSDHTKAKPTDLEHIQPEAKKIRAAIKSQGGITLT